ncbi:hypothetical protein [Roseburia intestinalis]
MSKSILLSSSGHINVSAEDEFTSRKLNISPFNIIEIILSFNNNKGDRIMAITGINNSSYTCIMHQVTGHG